MGSFDLVAPTQAQAGNQAPGADLVARYQERLAAYGRDYQTLRASQAPTPQQQQEQLLASFRGAMQQDAGMARLAKKFAAETQQPESVLYEDPEFAKRVLREREFEKLDLWRNNPAVAQLLQDTQFATLVSDDIDNLVVNDGILNSYWAGRQIRSGWEQTEEGRLWNQVMSAGGQPTFAQRLRLDELQGNLRQAQQDEGYVGPFLNVLGQITDPINMGSAIAAGTVGGPLGASAAVFATTQYTEYGSKYGQLREMGISHEVAMQEAWTYSLVAGAVEATGFGILSKPANGVLKSLVAGKVSTALSKKLSSQALRKAATDALVRTAEEVGVESIQTISGHLADIWAIEASDMDWRAKLDTMDGLESLSDQLADTVVKTVLGIGPIASFRPTMSLARDLRMAREAMQSTRTIQQLAENREKSKTAKEAPEEWAKVLQAQAEQSGTETVYIPGEQLEKALQAAERADIEQKAADAGVSVAEMQAEVESRNNTLRQQLEAKMPGLLQSVERAAANGEQFELPTAKFLEVFGDTRMLQLLKEHLKYQRDGITAAQAKAIIQAKEQLKKEARSRLEQDADQQKEIELHSQEIRDELLPVLKLARVEKGKGTVPMGKEDASTAIEFVVNMAIVAAGQDQMSVRDWWAQNKFTLLSGVSPEQARAAVAAQPTPVAPAAVPQTAPAAVATAAAPEATQAPAAAPQPAPTAAVTQQSAQPQKDVELQAAGRPEEASDAAYLDAVKRGDMEEAQRMVDEAAKAAGYTYEGYHASREDFNEFLSLAEQAEARGEMFEYDGYEGGNLGLGFYFTPNVFYARKFGSPRRFFLKIDNIIDQRNEDVVSRLKEIYQELVEDRGGATQGEAFDALAEETGATGIIAEDVGGFADGALEILVKKSSQAKLADPVTYDDAGNVIPLSQRFRPESPDIRYAAERGTTGPQGAYFTQTRSIALYEAATLTTFLHEASHWWMSTLFDRARRPDATEATKARLQQALRALDVADLQTWDALDIKMKEALHEQFAYNYEQYLLRNIAPTPDQRSLFAVVARWTRKLYRDLRSALSETYQREFNRPLPMLSPELRAVFDRMTATEEQIQASEMVRDLVPMFQTREQALASGMTEEEYDKFVDDVTQARESSIAALTAAAVDQMKALHGASNDVIAAKQKALAKERKAVRAEVEKDVGSQLIYRIMNWLRTGRGLDESGNAIDTIPAVRIDRDDIARVARSMPNAPKVEEPGKQVERDKQSLADAKAQLEMLNASIASDTKLVEQLREKHKNLPKTVSEGLDESGLIFRQREELAEIRQRIKAAEEQRSQLEDAVAKARAALDPLVKRKKALVPAVMSEEEWQKIYDAREARIPKAVRTRLEFAQANLDSLKAKLAEKGVPDKSPLPAKEKALQKQLSEANAALKKAQSAYEDADRLAEIREVRKLIVALEAIRKFANDEQRAQLVEHKARMKVLLQEQANALTKFGAAEKKRNQVQSNLLATQAKLRDAANSFKVSGSARTALVKKIAAAQSRVKTATEQVQEARARLRQADKDKLSKELAEAESAARNNEQQIKKLQSELKAKSQKLASEDRAAAAVDLRALRRRLESRERQHKQLTDRMELLEQRIDLGTPTLGGVVLDKIGKFVTKKDGITVSEAMQLWGWTGTAGEFVQALYSTPDFDAAVEAETDKRMLERFGDFNDPQAASDLVAGALHTEARTRMIAAELQWFEEHLRRMADKMLPEMAARAEVLQESVQQRTVAHQQLREQRQQMEQQLEQNAAYVEARKKRAAISTDLRNSAGPENLERRRELRQQLEAAEEEMRAAAGPEYAKLLDDLETSQKELSRARTASGRPVTSVSTLMAAAEQAAEEQINETRIRDINSGKHQSDEGRNNRRALEALKKDRLLEAMDAKRLQLLHHMLVRKAREAEGQVRKWERKMRDLFRSPRENIAKNYDVALYDAARAVAVMFGFGPKVASAKVAEQLQMLEQYEPALFARVQELVQSQAEVARDVWRGEDGRFRVRDLTMNQLRDVVETIDGILELARDQKTVETAEGKIEFEAAQSRLISSVSKVKPRWRGLGQQQRKSWRDSIREGLEGIRALLRSMEQWVVSLDGGRGPWWELVYNPIKSGLNDYAVRRNEYIRRFAMSLKELNLTSAENREVIVAAQLNGYKFQGLSELLGAMLHIGNQSNYRKLLLGREWGLLDQKGRMDDSRWREFIQQLEDEGKLRKEHYDWLQSVWDMMEELKPDLQQAHRKVFGFFFREVVYSPVSTRFGEYRGGYVPALTDPDMVRGRASEEEINLLQGDMRKAVPAVSSNWRHERIEAYAAPLSLDLTNMVRHLDMTIRFIHVQPAIKQTLRLVRSKEVSTALAEIDRAAENDLVIPWMVSAARQQASTKGMSRLVDRSLNYIRRVVGIDTMFANVGVAAGNLTSIPKAVPIIGWRYVMRGMQSLWHKTEQGGSFTDTILDRSKYMRNLQLGNMQRHLQIVDAQVNPNSQLKKVQNMAEANAYVLQVLTQQWANFAVWQGAYMKYTETMADGQTQEEAQRKAIEYADYVVRDTAPSLSPEDQARVLKGTPFMKLMLQFTGFFNWLANSNITAFSNLWRESGMMMFGRYQFYSQSLFGVVAPLFIGDYLIQMIAGRFWEEQDDEEDALFYVGGKVLDSVVRGTVAAVPFGSAALNGISAVYATASGDEKAARRFEQMARPSSPAIGAAERALRGSMAAARELGEAFGWTEGRDMTGRDYRDVLATLMLPLGLPSAWLGKPVQFAVDVSNDKYDRELTTADWMRGMLSGRTEMSR